MISEEDKIMMETLYWWGIPTLFRCKNDPDPNNCDIALVGVPHSTGNGTTEIVSTPAQSRTSIGSGPPGWPGEFYPQ